MVNMDRYIKRDDVYALFDKSGMANLHVADIDVIQDADVIPVVHGKWIDVREKRLFGDHYFLCSKICKDLSLYSKPMNNNLLVVQVPLYLLVKHFEHSMVEKFLTENLIDLFFHLM